MILILKDCSIAQSKPHLPHLNFKKDEAVELDDYLEKDLIKYGLAVKAILAGAIAEDGSFIDTENLLQEFDGEEKSIDEVLKELEESDEVLQEQDEVLEEPYEVLKELNQFQEEDHEEQQEKFENKMNNINYNEINPAEPKKRGRPKSETT